MNKNIITYHDEFSQVSEKFRILRTNIKTYFLKKNHKENIDISSTKVITVSSASLGEGKTFSAVNLAVVMAKELDSKVLLIDCDLRDGAGGIEELISNKTPKSLGLSDIFLNKTAIDEVIQSTDLKGLSYIAKGSFTGQPTELLGSIRMIQFLDKLKGMGYSYIILDTPSILSYTDAGILGAMSDGVVLVVKAETTQHDAVRKAINLFKHSHAEIIGLILNGTELFR